MGRRTFPPTAPTSGLEPNRRMAASIDPAPISVPGSNKQATSARACARPAPAAAATPTTLSSFWIVAPMTNRAISLSPNTIRIRSISDRVLVRNEDSVASAAVRSSRTTIVTLIAGTATYPNCKGARPYSGSCAEALRRNSARAWASWICSSDGGLAGWPCGFPCISQWLNASIVSPRSRSSRTDSRAAYQRRSICGAGERNSTAPWRRKCA